MARPNNKEPYPVWWVLLSVLSLSKDLSKALTFRAG
jgi:hypothetical protein